MKNVLFGFLLLASFAAPARGAGLQLSIQDGKVTLDAQDVTIRQILTEWARVGKTRIVNVERVTGGPVTLKFEALAEKQALDIVLRAVPGYVAAPRAALMADASSYETILIMPTTTAVAVRPPGPALGGPNPGANVTQLRQMTPVAPLAPADNNQEPPDAQDDPAIAAAAAAGLIPAALPGTVTTAAAPIKLPGTNAQPPAPEATPANPWGAPTGTPQPSLAPPPPPVQTQPQPTVRPRPPQADR